MLAPIVRESHSTMRARRIFVFAMPRSGSTLLCDLLSIPGRGVVLHEPMMMRRFGDGREGRILRTLRAHGLHVESSSAEFAPGVNARTWYDNLVIPELDRLEYWGLKEVFLEDAEPLVKCYAPDRIVLLWRDPKDVALSLIELMNRALMSFTDRQTLKDEAWALECVRESAHQLTQLAGRGNAMRLRYEDLVRSTDHQRALLNHVGLDRFSEVAHALTDDESSVRAPEVRMHQERLSRKSVNRFDKEPLGWRRTFATICHAAVSDDASFAGYLKPDPCSRQWSVAPTKATADRLADPSYDPGPGFDYAYARRRARLKVAPLLAPGESVLDIGSSVASLIFLAPQSKVTVVDDGAPGKRVLSKQWRQGVFPTLDQFDTATFVFSLEFTVDPLRMIHSLVQRQINIIVCYHCTDDFPMQDRISLQFTSHLCRADWVNFASSQSTSIQCDWAFDGFQSLIRIGEHPWNPSQKP